MKKIEAKKQHKREVILRAALDIFLTEGYIGSSMDSIARGAGVTKQTVYRYFSTKEELFQEALEAQREATPRSYLDALEIPDSAEALMQFATSFLEVHMSWRHLAAIRLLVAEGPSAPEITRAFFAGGPRKSIARLAAFLQKRFDLDDPEHAAMSLISTLLALRMNVLTGLEAAPSQEVIAGHAQRTVALYLKFLS